MFKAYYLVGLFFRQIFSVTVLLFGDSHQVPTRFFLSSTEFAAHRTVEVVTYITTQMSEYVLRKQMFQVTLQL